MTTALATWSLSIGRTTGEFLVGTERDYDDEGFPFEYEYIYLDHSASVDVRLDRQGETDTYAQACREVLGYVTSLVNTSLIIRFNAAQKDGMSFVAGGWMRPADALTLLESILASAS